MCLFERLGSYQESVKREDAILAYKVLVRTPYGLMSPIYSGDPWDEAKERRAVDETSIDRLLLNTRGFYAFKNKKHAKFYAGIETGETAVVCEVWIWGTVIFHPTPAKSYGCGYRSEYMSLARPTPKIPRRHKIIHKVRRKQPVAA